MANAILLNQSTEVTGDNILGALAHDLLINVRTDTNDNQLVFTKLLESSAGEDTTEIPINFSDWKNWIDTLGFANKAQHVDPLSSSLETLNKAINDPNGLKDTVEDLKDTVEDLDSTVNTSRTGLKDIVSSLNTTITDPKTGLSKTVTELSTTVGNLNDTITELTGPNGRIKKLEDSTITVGSNNDLSYESV